MAFLFLASLSVGLYISAWILNLIQLQKEVVVEMLGISSLISFLVVVLRGLGSRMNIIIGAVFVFVSILAQECFKNFYASLPQYQLLY